MIEVAEMLLVATHRSVPLNVRGLLESYCDRLSEPRAEANQHVEASIPYLQAPTRGVNREVTSIRIGYRRIQRVLPAIVDS